MLKRLALLTTVAALVVAVPISAHAVAMLEITDNGNTVTITDDGPGDGFAGLGVIGFSGAVGTNWTVNVTTGISKPVLGSASDPNMDLNSVNVTSLSGGTLSILFTDTDFILPTGPASTFTTDIGGTTDGSLVYNLWLDDSNAAFGITDLLIGPESLGPNAFSASFSGSLPGDNPSGLFSLTLGAEITHTGAGQVTSFDAEVNVPEPTTLTLLGIGLAGLGFMTRRRRS